MVGHQIQRAQPESPHVFAGEGKALVKDRENLAERQKAKLDQLKSAGSRLFRAWGLEEDPRAAYRARGAASLM